EPVLSGDPFVASKIDDAERGIHFGETFVEEPRALGGGFGEFAERGDIGAAHAEIGDRERRPCAREPRLCARERLQALDGPCPRPRHDRPRETLCARAEQLGRASQVRVVRARVARAEERCPFLRSVRGMKKGRQRACERLHILESSLADRNRLLALDDFVGRDESKPRMLSIRANFDSQRECLRCLSGGEAHLSAKKQVAKLALEPTSVGFVIFFGAFDLDRGPQRFGGVKRFAYRLRRLDRGRRLGHAAAQPDPGREHREYEKTDQPPRVHSGSGWRDRAFGADSRVKLPPHRIPILVRSASYRSLRAPLAMPPNASYYPPTASRQRLNRNVRCQIGPISISCEPRTSRRDRKHSPIRGIRAR